mmetsp:Transcript_23007/g.66931  ORF Transcript_23007/g.66931 Transcript_23007/m.66931 type:complete len:210 (+) Transcript_23007:454-1083(+)
MCTANHWGTATSANHWSNRDNQSLHGTPHGTPRILRSKSTWRTEKRRTTRRSTTLMRRIRRAAATCTRQRSILEDNVGTARSTATTTLRACSCRSRGDPTGRRGLSAPTCTPNSMPAGRTPCPPWTCLRRPHGGCRLLRRTLLPLPPPPLLLLLSWGGAVLGMEAGGVAGTTAPEDEGSPGDFRPFPASDPPAAGGSRRRRMFSGFRSQ